MILSEMLSADRIQINPASREKNEVIGQLIDLACEAGGIQNREEFRRSVFEREALQSTGLADGLAIPHAKTPHVTDLVVCLSVCPDGIDFDSVDEQPTHLIFLIAVPENQSAPYLRLLSQIARTFGKSQVRERVLMAKTAHEVIQIIRGEEGAAESRSE